ncbi:MAG: hypothetical protein V3T53_11755 [Phycisphaerales bacterium]
MRSVGRQVVGFLGGLGILGCASAPGPNHDPSDGPTSLGPNSSWIGDTQTSDWPFWPEALRIHPLTRLAVDAKSGLSILEVRLEFLDPEGHTTKGVGQVRIDLAAGGSGADTSPPIATWNWDLRDRSVNRTLYDDVTRTYLFRLKVHALELGPQLELRAYLLSASGQRLQATHTLRVE